MWNLLYSPKCSLDKWHCLGLTMIAFKHYFCFLLVCVCVAVLDTAAVGKTEVGFPSFIKYSRCFPPFSLESVGRGWPWQQGYKIHVCVCVWPAQVKWLLAHRSAKHPNSQTTEMSCAHLQVIKQRTCIIITKHPSQILANVKNCRKEMH